MGKEPSDLNLERIKSISKLLDSKFRIPQTRIRFGLDPIFGLFPILGDLGTYAVSLFIIHIISKHGASGKLITKMLLNASADVIFGSIPILGTIFDVGFRSNEKNLRLLQEYYEEGKHRGSGKGILIAVLIGVILIIGLLLYLLILMLVKFAGAAFLAFTIGNPKRGYKKNIIEEKKLLIIYLSNNRLCGFPLI